MEFQDDVTIFLDYDVIIFDDVNPLGYCDVINAPTPLGRTPTLPLLISVSKNGEVYTRTPKSSCMKRTSVHIKNMGYRLEKFPG